MFTQQCLIHKNTKEIINFLNEIGYTLYEDSDNFSKNVACSCKFNTYFTFDDDEYVFPNTIDCKKNKELFFAVVALRDDSDKFQYFTNGEKWIKCSQLELKHELDNNYEEFCVADFHKATVEELIEHFNK